METFFLLPAEEGGAPYPVLPPAAFTSQTSATPPAGSPRSVTPSITPGGVSPGPSVGPGAAQSPSPRSAPNTPAGRLTPPPEGVSVPVGGGAAMGGGMAESSSPRRSYDALHAAVVGAAQARAAFATTPQPARPPAGAQVERSGSGRSLPSRPSRPPDEKEGVVGSGDDSDSPAGPGSPAHP